MKIRTRARELGISLRREISHFCNEADFRRVKRRNIEVDGKKVTFIGVEHNRRTFEKHKGLFEQAIRDSDALVVESKNPNDEFYGPLNELAEKHKKESYCFEGIGKISKTKKYVLLGYKALSIALIVSGMITIGYIAATRGLNELKDYFLTIGLGGSMMFTGFICALDATYRLVGGRIRDLVTSWNATRVLAKKEIEKITIFYGMSHLVGILYGIGDKERTEREIETALTKGEVHPVFTFPRDATTGKVKTERIYSN